MKQKGYPTVTVLGSTGSVGEQALDVARQTGAAVRALCANRNVRRVEEQAREFRTQACAMADERAAADLRVRLADTGVRVYAGTEGICEMLAASGGGDGVVLNAIIGEAGLRPTLAALEAGARLALANKESLVCAGEAVMALAAEKGTEILPVDSEHCAIFQCLRAGARGEIRRILLTASGGPFYGYTAEQLKEITVERALAHPTWRMGAKITVDSATLMNKGFEVIEAVHLFGVRPEQIEVLVHRESIMHSAVEYTDNSIIAQLSVPDMRLCVQYALAHPARAGAVIPQLDLTALGRLSFARPDTATFPLLRVALEAIAAGGAVPAVLNAANEVAVAAFLDRRLSFCGISELVEEAVSRLRASAAGVRSVPGILECDAQARELAEELLAKRA